METAEAAGEHKVGFHWVLLGYENHFKVLQVAESCRQFFDESSLHSRHYIRIKFLSTLCICMFCCDTIWKCTLTSCMQIEANWLQLNIRSVRHYLYDFLSIIFRDSIATTNCASFVRYNRMQIAAIGWGMGRARGRGWRWGRQAMRLTSWRRYRPEPYVT